MIISHFKTSPFAQFLRQAQILILKILYVFLRLKFSPSLNLNKIEGFEMAYSSIGLIGCVVLMEKNSVYIKQTNITTQQIKRMKLILFPQGVYLYSACLSN